MKKHPAEAIENNDYGHKRYQSHKSAWLKNWFFGLHLILLPAQYRLNRV